VDATKEAAPSAKETCSAPPENNIFFFGYLKRQDLDADRYLLSKSGKRDVKGHLLILKETCFSLLRSKMTLKTILFS
jgi:hypothetical protein